jgi:pimeloyl-ACP methyl ester carboxylesterase
MPSVRVDDTTQLHYRCVGEGALPVLLVHGWMASGNVFDRMLPALASSGLRCIIPDHRGTGASTTTSEDESIERLARDMIAVADAEGLAQFAVVGHSKGGQIAQWIASELPDRVTSLALLNPVPASGIPLPPEAVELFVSSGGDRGKQGAILDLACKQLSPADREWLLDEAGRIAPERIARMFRVWSGAAFVPRLAAIRARTLVLATDDPFLPPALLRSAVVDLIAGAQLHTLAGPGHYPQVERPSETGDIVRAFLTAVA